MMMMMNVVNVVNVVVVFALFDCGIKSPNNNNISYLSSKITVFFIQSIILG